MLTEEWKSARCGNGACVEVSKAGDQILVRNSKTPGVVGVFSKDEWLAFINGAKDGEFDL